jgi:hypothetical protein
LLARDFRGKYAVLVLPEYERVWLERTDAGETAGAHLN